MTGFIDLDGSVSITRTNDGGHQIFFKDKPQAGPGNGKGDLSDLAHALNIKCDELVTKSTHRRNTYRSTNTVDEVFEIERPTSINNDEPRILMLKTERSGNYNSSAGSYRGGSGRSFGRVNRRDYSESWFNGAIINDKALQILAEHGVVLSRKGNKSPLDEEHLTKFSAFTSDDDWRNYDRALHFASFKKDFHTLQVPGESPMVLKLNPLVEHGWDDENYMNARAPEQDKSLFAYPLNKPGNALLQPGQDYESVYLKDGTPAIHLKQEGMRKLEESGLDASEILHGISKTTLNGKTVFTAHRELPPTKIPTEELQVAEVEKVHEHHRG